MLSGCFEENRKNIPGSGTAVAAMATRIRLQVNQAPTISGSPPPDVLEGEVVRVTAECQRPRRRLR